MAYDPNRRIFLPDFGSDVQVPQAPGFQMPQAPQQNTAFKDAFMNRLTQQPTAQPQAMSQLGPAGAAEAGPAMAGEGVLGKLGSAASAGAKASGIGKIAESL